MNLAGNAKAARRQVSCPGDIERPVSPTLYNAIQGTEYFMSQSCSSLSSNVRLSRSISERQLPCLFPKSSTLSKPLLLYLIKRFPPSILSKLAAVHDIGRSRVALEFKEHPSVQMFLNQLFQSSEEILKVADSFKPLIEVHKDPAKAHELFTAIRRDFAFVPTLTRLVTVTQAHGGSIHFNATTAPKQEVKQPLLRRKRLERNAKRKDPITHMDWLNISPRYLIVSVESTENSLASMQRDLPGRP